MSLPDDNSILRLHQKYAPHDQAFELVYGHCQIIAEVAEELLARQPNGLNAGLVRAAALLHDIGYYPLFDDSGYVPKDRLITHGVVGADLLRNEGVPEAICRIAERHTGVGLTREHILQTGLPLPARDLVPETPEEWLIAYADKMHTKALVADVPHSTIGWFVSTESYLQHALTFGAANKQRFAELIERFGTVDLAVYAQRHRQPLK